jgi:phosphatidyl-myo-inositol dimannoside synthase
MQSPTIAAITRHPTGGGIAVVADLLWKTVECHWGSRAHMLTMYEHEARPATMAEKARFAVSLASLEMTGSTDWVLFSHLALAHAHSMVPSVRRPGYGVFLHGIEVWRPLPEKTIRMLAGADLRIANSRYTADRASALHPAIGPIEVCPLALLHRPPVGAAAPDGLRGHAVLVVGRMAESERYKGHDQLIDAWDRVTANVPDAQLVIVGDGNDRARLEARARASRSSTSILFTGFVSDATLQQLYRSAALFALPSRGEGFGLVYLEAMRAGLACVGSRHDAASEVIVDGQTGCLVDQGDTTEIADTISRLLTNDDERRALGEAGRRRFEQEFTFERFSHRLIAILGGVGQERAAS